MPRLITVVSALTLTGATAALGFALSPSSSSSHLVRWRSPLSPVATAPEAVLTPTVTTLFARRRRGENETGIVTSAPFDYVDDRQPEGRRHNSALYASATVTAAATLTVDGTAASQATASSLDQQNDDPVEEALSLVALPTTTSTTSWTWTDLSSVLTAALLVTGNTVGAGALVLPELAARPGFSISTALFTGAYLVNLVSGLILAEVAIKQHESQQQTQKQQQPGTKEETPPSSFRDLASLSLESPAAANGIAAVSLLVNTCALTFSLGRGGVILAGILNMQGIDHVTLSVVLAVLLAGMGATQSRVRISQLSSVVVAALFGSVAGLIVPGLAQVADPLATLWAPGTAAAATGGDDGSGVMTAMLDAAPIMLTTLIFQNIVPPVTRILGYDRTKSVAALVLGSFLPLALYLSWSFVVLGGGVDTTLGGGSSHNPLMTIFSVAAVTGSAIGCTMAVSEELETFFGKNDSSDVSLSSTAATATTKEPHGGVTTTTLEKNHQDKNANNGYALPAVLVAVGVPLVGSLLCHDYTDALKLSGGYGIPVLYGAIPVLMLWTQRRKSPPASKNDHLIPGGSASLGLVAAAFGGFLVNSVVGDVSHFVVAVSV